MNWDKVGNWLSENATGILGVVGAVATGGSSAGIAAAASMIMKATNENTPEAALAALKANPETLLELERLANAEEADIRSHHREMLQMQLEDGQKAHEQQQETIRTGDTSQDEYVRHTPPENGASVLVRHHRFLSGHHCSRVARQKTIGRVDPDNRHADFLTRTCIHGFPHARQAWHPDQKPAEKKLTPCKNHKACALIWSQPTRN